MDENTIYALAKAGDLDVKPDKLAGNDIDYLVRVIIGLGRRVEYLEQRLQGEDI